MSNRVPCPYCAGTEQGRCTSVAAGRYITECASCGRVVEERLTQVEELFVERAQDTPLCIVTPDFSSAQCDRPPPPPMEDDPFENTGFITAFSAWSLDRTPLYTVTATTFCGYLAELERVLLEEPPAAPASYEGVNSNNNCLGLVDNLRAYLQIVDVASILGLDRDISDHAIQLFRDCACTTYLRNRNIEALATAALVQAMREAHEPRTLQEISAAANVQQKEIGKYLKILGDALKLSQPINSNSISVHMPRFCSLLQLSKTTQDLATHIGEVVINKCFCTRRNPISISAAAIYLACQLEDKRKTQAEICKATGLTEVTLRKVYKELLENWDDLLPKNYTPAVPPEKAFPMTAAALGRASAARADINGGVLNVASALDSSVTVTSSLSSATVVPECTQGTGSGSCNPSALQSFGHNSGSHTSEYVSTTNFRASTPSSEGKSTGQMFVLQTVAKEENMDSEKRVGKNPEDLDKDYIQDTENRINNVDPGLNSGSLNFMSQFSTAEDKGGNSSNRKNEEPLHSTTKGYSFVLPNLGEMNNHTFTSSPRPDFHRAVTNATHKSSESDQKNDIQRDREKVNAKEVSCEREGNGAGNQVLPQFLRGSPAALFSTFGPVASATSSTTTQSFPSNIFSYQNPLGSGLHGMLTPQILSNYGAFCHSIAPSAEMHVSPDKGNLSLWGDKLSHGTTPTSAVGEALSRLASTNIGTGMSMVQPKGSQPSPSHSVWSQPPQQLSFSTVNGGNHAYGNTGDGHINLKRDVLEGNVISNIGRPRSSGEGTNLNWPSSEGQSITGLNLSFGPDHTAG
ncbi:hypothetical protein SUGI_0591680 [Cryptomeria japonica]|uniref:uncharacterized protein LOC131050119 isoform X2 n=1 Tax=Cryptomeria japonica TaxID=3369 RepID=UPI002414BBB7|nr:uncharacterized protein LOC131050119 isoform X2 [Cryptomeria japonica]GLJ29927.1 hypothetical protein SUGI_0591680 [Cryptomeria japonica]